MTKTLRSRLKAGVALTAICSQLALTAGPASAFCGFYVAKADAKMFNKSSKVVLARIGQQTAITMASDYEGKPSEFALVVPVPTFIKKEQISVVDTKTIDHLDAFTAPRLVEYYDPDPCERDYRGGMLALATATPSAAIPAPPMQAYPGVKVEARYDVAEYDISILSAEQSDGLIRWLTDNGYKIPAGAEPVIGSYIKQKMHFFVAKVNIKRFDATGARVSEAAAGTLRDQQVHAAAAARDGERKRPAGSDHLRIDASGTRRSHQLSHREGAIQRRRAAVRRPRFSECLQGAVRPRRGAAKHAWRVRRIRLGHGLVRSVRRAAAEQTRIDRAWRRLGAGRWRQRRSPIAGRRRTRQVHS